MTARTDGHPDPAAEARRLAALRGLAVLDTLSEPVFDAIVAAAAQACDVPIALVSLVDERRQWFKANLGLPGATETPREVAFCDHAIRSDQVLVVPDASDDRRFAANPLVTGEPNIRFYAGAPIVLPQGERIGTVCVIDRQPRMLSDTQLRLLEGLGRIAAVSLAERHQQVLTTRALADSEARLRGIAEAQRLAQQRLEAALREKETLLKEVYHRVKNNLQVVTSLLQMQLRTVAGTPAQRALAESARRVRAMALVHELLYQQDDLSEVPLPAHLDALLRQIDDATGASQRGLRLQAEVAAGAAPLELAVPLALLVNELVCNALEHGFAPGQAGQVRVTLDRQAGLPRLRVSDDGRGLPPGFSLPAQRSMGLQLAASLAEQLGGRLAAVPGERGGAGFEALLPRLARG